MILPRGLQGLRFSFKEAFSLSRASSGEQEFPQEDLPGGDSLSSEKDQQSTKLKVYFSKYYLANNFAKTNICCAFLESEKANFHFFSLPSLFYSTSFSSSTHRVSTSTFTDTITITTTPHFESLAFLSTLCQEFLLEGLQNSQGLASQLSGWHSRLRGYKGRATLTFQGHLNKVVPLLISWLIAERVWEPFAAFNNFCCKKVLPYA